MSKHTNKYWLKKVKLWCSLHGVNIENATNINCNETCPHWLNSSTNTTGCNLKWPDKLSVDMKLTKAGKEGYEGNKYVFCIEWIKHV